MDKKKSVYESSSKSCIFIIFIISIKQDRQGCDAGGCTTRVYFLAAEPANFSIEKPDIQTSHQSFIREETFTFKWNNWLGAKRRGGKCFMHLYKSKKRQ